MHMCSCKLADYCPIVDQVLIDLNVDQVSIGMLMEMLIEMSSTGIGQIKVCNDGH